MLSAVIEPFVVRSLVSNPLHKPRSILRSPTQCPCYDQNSPMRILAPTSTVRATTSLLASSPLVQRPGLVRTAGWLRIGQRSARGFAKVRDNKELGLNKEIWFGSNAPLLLPVEGPGSGFDHKPPDERMLKLGKSKAYPACHTGTLDTKICQQLCECFKSGSHPYSRIRFHKRSSLLRSRFSCSPRRIHIYLQSQAESPIQPPYGPRLSLGVVFPSLGMSSSSSSLSAWSKPVVEVRVQPSLQRRRTVQAEVEVVGMRS